MTKTAIVTGAARGIGLATTDVLREQGWQVAMVDRDAPELTKVAAERDGVLAIVITIMVLELKVPHGHELADLRPLLSGPMRREIVYAPTVVAALCEDPSVIAVRVVDVERGASTRPCR